MEFLKKREIFNLVQFLFNNHTSEEYKNLLLLKYNSKLTFDEIIEEIMIDTYRVYHKDQKNLDFYLKFLAHKYLDDRDINILKEEIVQKLWLNSECGNLSLKENHEAVDKALLFICRELNARNVDYYVFGSVPIYVKLNIPFSRFHSDIDIAINGNDIGVLKEIFNNSDYEYIDNRYCSQKFFDYDEKRARGGHEIIAQNKTNDFSIGFFEFERSADGSIVKKDYFTELNNGKLINKVCKCTYSKEFADLCYSDEKLKYKDVEFRYCTVEGLYLFKKNNYKNIGRNKDFYDINIIDNNYELDHDKLKKIEKLIKDTFNYKIEELD